MSLSLDTHDCSCHVIQIAVDIFMLHEFVSEAAVLIIMTEYDVHAASLFFVTNSSHVTVFIAVEALHDSAFFVKQLISLELAFEDQFFIN